MMGEAHYWKPYYILRPQSVVVYQSELKEHYTEIRNLILGSLRGVI
jgi:hypothetical protein